MTAEGRKGEGKVLDEDQQVCRTHMESVTLMGLGYYWELPN